MTGHYGTKLIYYGALTEIAATNEEVIDVPEQFDIKRLLEFLNDRYTGFDQFTVKVAVNNELVTGNARLDKGTEVTLLPPYAGG